MSSLRVLGIDPGLTRCGVGIVDVDRSRRATLVHVGVVRTPADADLAERLAGVAAGIRAVIDEHRPTAVAVERVFAQQNRQTVMGTAQASGVALLIAAEAGLPAATHTPIVALSTPAMKSLATVSPLGRRVTSTVTAPLLRAAARR